MTTLADSLADWTDFDEAAHALALQLGLAPEGSSAADRRHVYWSKNPLGDALCECILALVRAGVLERIGTRFRWRSDDHAPRG